MFRAALVGALGANSGGRLTDGLALFPAEHHFLDLGGVRIYYATAGSGETVPLLHGNPSWSFLYRKILAGLQDEFRCVGLPRVRRSSTPPGHSFPPGTSAAGIFG